MTKEKAVTDFIIDKVGVNHPVFDTTHVDPIHRPVKTQYNAAAFPKYSEANTLPSETVPNQTMSLRTLLDRYAKGLPITGNASEPAYYGDEQMPDLNKMDISEIHDLKNAVKSDIEQKQKILRDQKAAADKAAHEKHINDEVEKRSKAKSDKDDSKGK